MVVLAASIVSKTGKALISRHFADMTRIRIEGLLAAFPKLVGVGKQHTFVETDNVRYVYQPKELLYLLLVTNKQSNILEDLETLRLFSNIMSDICPSMDEEAVFDVAFDLIFAIDELISLGHKENVTIPQVKQYIEMESHEERLHKLIVQSKIDEAKDVMMRKASAIDKNKLERQAGSGRYENGFHDLKSVGNGGFKSNSTFGSVDSNGLSNGLPKTDRSSAPASAPSKNLGMKLGKGRTTTQFLESLKAEGEIIVEEVHPVAGPLKAALVVTDPINISIEERLVVTLKKDGGLEKFDLHGTMTLVVQNSEHAQICVQVETAGANKNVQLKTHPRIDKDIFSKEKLLRLKDTNASFPVGTPLDVLKWRMQSRDESLVPLNINCWPSVSGRECLVNIEYEASRAFELKNVVISIPLPALRDSPIVNQADGDWRYDSRRSVLEWSILLIDNTNRSGSMEFVVSNSDPSVFFPIDVNFSASKFFCNVKVADLTDVNNGLSVKYGGQTQLVVENFQVM